MSLFHDAPLTDRLHPGAQQAEVVVRAGKTFLCTACGTLVEVPADVVGQLVMTPDPPDNRALKRKLAKMQRTTKKPSGKRGAGSQASAASGLPSSPPGNRQPDRQHLDKPQPSENHSDDNRPDQTPPGMSQPAASGAAPPADDAKSSQAQPPKLPSRPSFAGRTIDGLQVPTGRALDRAVAWVCFRLKVLAQKDEEKERLLKLLKQHRRRARRSGGCRNVHEQRPQAAPRKQATLKQTCSKQATRQTVSAGPKQKSDRPPGGRRKRRALPMAARRDKQNSSSKSFRSGTPRAARPKASRRAGSRCARYAPGRGPP